MTIEDTIRQLIKVYPIKEAEKYPSLDWKDATDKKNSILREIEDNLYNSLNSYAHTLYPDNDYMLVIGSLFGVGDVVSQEKLPRPIETYYLRTGIMFGEGDWQTDKFLFELDAQFHKNGKKLYYGKGKLKLKKRAFDFFKFSVSRICEVYEMPEPEF